jgi:hypothetical protein
MSATLVTNVIIGRMFGGGCPLHKPRAETFYSFRRVLLRFAHDTKMHLIYILHGPKGLDGAVLQKRKIRE